tara:strand:+ start:170 stop:457 length:288 start_codon:yes stop_codon:yes gene_type:complete
MENRQEQQEPETLLKSKYLIRKPLLKRLKKTIAVVVLPLVYIVIDGTLTYDIFDFKMDTPFKWFVFLIILVLFLAIYVSDEKADNKKLDSSKFDE